MGIKFQSYNNLLKILGKELVQHAKISGVAGIIHSDEISKYGVKPAEIKEVRNALDATENCGFVLIAEKEAKAKKALELVFKRALQAIEGVPEETRDPQPDGTTTYSRPLPGSERMYPETDIPPVSIEREKIKFISAHLPELLDKKIERFVEQYGINKEQANQLIDINADDIFEKFALKYKFPSVIARTFINTIPELVAEGIEKEKITENILDCIFANLEKQKFAKEAIPQILKYLVENPDKDIEHALESCKIISYSDAAVEKIIEKLLQEKSEFVKEKGMNALSPLMGIIMKDLRGRVDGKTVAEILKRKLQTLF